jgi:polar amino acid transport system substrate-binding protein
MYVNRGYAVLQRLYKSIFVLCQMSAMFFAVSLSFTAQAKDLHICYETSGYPPFTLGKDAVPKRRKGSMVELVARAVKNVGFHPLFYRRPWSRCIKDVISGKADGIFPMVWAMGRDDWGHFPRLANGQLDDALSMRKATYRVFVPVKRKTQWDGEKFSNLSSGIGAPFGYAVYYKLKDARVLSSMTLDSANGFKMLALNRLDGYVVEQKIGLKITESKGWKNKIKMLPAPYHTSHFHLLMSNPFYLANTDGAESIWQEINQLRTVYIKNP